LKAPGGSDGSCAAARIQQDCNVETTSDAVVSKAGAGSSDPLRTRPERLLRKEIISSLMFSVLLILIQRRESDFIGFKTKKVHVVAATSKIGNERSQDGAVKIVARQF
jgi:hypothetical protein